MRRERAWSGKAAARCRCEEGCGTMERAPDHRSETAHSNRSGRPVLRFIENRSWKIIERRMPDNVTIGSRTGIASPATSRVTGGSIYGNHREPTSPIFTGEYPTGADAVYRSRARGGGIQTGASSETLKLSEGFLAARVSRFLVSFAEVSHPQKKRRDTH